MKGIVPPFWTLVDPRQLEHTRAAERVAAEYCTTRLTLTARRDSGLGFLDIALLFRRPVRHRR